MPANTFSSQPDPDLDISNLGDSNELVLSSVVPLVASPEREPPSDCFVFRDATSITLPTTIVHGLQFYGIKIKTDPLRAVNTLMRKGMGHTAVSTI